MKNAAMRASSAGLRAEHGGSPPCEKSRRSVRRLENSGEPRGSLVSEERTVVEKLDCITYGNELFRDGSFGNQHVVSFNH